MSYYRELNVILLGTMLAHGKDKEAAEVLFDAYDTATTDVMNQETLTIMFEDLFYTIAEALPMVAEGDGEEQIKLDLLQTYKDSLVRGKDKALKEIKEYLFPKEATEITRADFIKKMRKRPDLLTATGFRQFLDKAGEVKFARFQRGEDFVTDIDKLIENKKPLQES